MASIDTLSLGGQRIAVHTLGLRPSGVVDDFKDKLADLRSVVPLAVADALCPAPTRSSFRGPTGRQVVCAGCWMGRRIRCTQEASMHVGPRDPG